MDLEAIFLRFFLLQVLQTLILKGDIIKSIRKAIEKEILSRRIMLRRTNCSPKGLFRRHDFVSLTKSCMILSCMIFLFRRHYNVMCDFF